MAKKILFIDSDESFAQGLSQAASSRGHAPLVSTNSEQGITLARQEAPDLIVVCVEAQPTNGYMLCTRLKKDDRLKSIPVILTSANATADSFEKHKKLKTRADEYLIKPFVPSSLFEKANALLGLPADGGAEEIIEMDDEPLAGIGDLVVDQDEPIQVADADVVAQPQADDELIIDEVEEVVEIDESAAPASGSDSDLQMFDQAFDALEMPGMPKHDHDHPDTMPIQTALAAEEPDEAIALTPEAANEAKSGAPPAEPVNAANSDGEKSIDDLLGQLDGSAAVEPPSELEQRVQQLEQELAAVTAELEAERQSITGGSVEVRRLKETRNKQDKEILRLREELTAKERELVEVQERQTSLETQLESHRGEDAKRGGAAKALQQRAEALAAAAKKFERELTHAREELKALPILKAELAGARELHAQESTQLKGQVTSLEHELRAAKADVLRLNGDLDAQRAEMQTVAGEKELLGDEREELKKAVAEAQAQAATNEERAVQAYKHVKGYERVRERMRKALTIALQLLDEAPPVEVVGDEPPTGEIAKQSA